MKSLKWKLYDTPGFQRCASIDRHGSTARTESSTRAPACELRRRRRRAHNQHHRHERIQRLRARRILPKTRAAVDENNLDAVTDSRRTGFDDSSLFSFTLPIFRLFLHLIGLSLSHPAEFDIDVLFPPPVQRHRATLQPADRCGNSRRRRDASI